MSVHTPLTREALRPLVGLPVHVTGRLARTGGVKVGRHDLITLLLSEIIAAPGIDIEHAWVRFGPTGSARIQKLRRRLDPGLTVRLDAKVSMYETDGVPRLGLAAPHNAEVLVGGKWKLIIRGIERYGGDDYDDELYEDTLFEITRAEQQAVMTALRECPGRDAACEQMLLAYWVRGELVSERQLAHARRFLCSP